MIMGELIKRERESSGKTRRAVVDNLGITEPYLFAIENGLKQPQIPRDQHGRLDIRGSLYYVILTNGLGKNPDEAESLILDAKFQELGLSHPILRHLLRDEVTGRISPLDRQAILVAYEGLRLMHRRKRKKGPELLEEACCSAKRPCIAKRSTAARQRYWGGRPELS